MTDTSREAVEGLIAECREEGANAWYEDVADTLAALLAAVESVLALHVPETRAAFGADGYEEGEYEACTGCWDEWPCPTVRAITNALEGGE